MAAINSHRRRQVYGIGISRRQYGYTYGNNAPYGAATIMPDKDMHCNSYGAGKRQFADPNDMLNRKYFGNTVSTKYNYPVAGSNMRAYTDHFITTPGGMLNIGNSYVSRVILSTTGNSNSIASYLSEHTGVAGFLGYARQRTGLIHNGGSSYKQVIMPDKTKNYMQVMSLADYQGGNIKTRATIMKWSVGMWRAK